MLSADGGAVAAAVTTSTPHIVETTFSQENTFESAQDLSFQPVLDSPVSWLEAEDKITDESDSSEINASEAKLNPKVELVFVDTSIADYKIFVHDIRSSSNERPIEVFLLDGSKDGIAQISEVLSTYSDEQVAALHVISHGSHASVELGSTTLDIETLSNYQEKLASWSDKFTENGDLLLYGCLTGKDNSKNSFISQLSEFTGADVAASEDATGGENFGGDWDLEATTGTIEAEIAISSALQASYQSTLQTMYIADSGRTNSSGKPIDASGNVIDDNNQNPQFDPWGTTITDTSITKLDLSKVTKNLAIRVLANQKAEIVRSGLSSKNKIIVDLNRVTEIIGTSVGSKTTELDLSAINTDSEITLIGRGKVSVVIPGFNLLTHTTGQNLSF